MTTLILIRHGESEANRHGFFAGQTNADLQNKGLKQAELTAKYVMENYKVDKIYSSDLIRAKKTAMCLSRLLDMEITEDKNLREIYAGEWEGKTFDELTEKYPEAYEVWKTHIGRAVCTGGESVKELGKRTLNALTKIAEDNDGKTVVVATHATPIRIMQSLIETGSLDEMENIAWVSNASLSIFEYDNGWKINEISIDAHLAELKTILTDNV